MSQSRSSTVFRRMDELELALCVFFNRASRRWTVERVFVAVSRLGNGVFWYVLMLLLPLSYGVQGLQAAVHMAVVGLVALVIYKILKVKMVRQRPYISWDAIRNGTAPLDVYSFPSGHTLHATCFSIIAIAYFPWLAWLLAPFAILVALSRVVLGLHYPTDVLVGALIGVLLSVLSFELLPLL